MKNSLIESMGYCDRCRSIILREEETKSCIKCGGTMIEVGWVETTNE